MSVRVRFAPSPTGPLHMGGVRTALYNYLLARKEGGVFVLRIEDTDQTRYVPGAEDYIKEALQWCGIEPDEGPDQGGPFGPYRQSERKDTYARYANQLIESGWAYYAFDTAEEIDAKREEAKEAGQHSWQYDAATRMGMRNSETLGAEETARLIEGGAPYTVRFKIPSSEEVVFHDEIRGEVRYNTDVLDDKVLFKSDGMPTYHLANVVDDYAMKITHVIRGEEWLPSAPLHVLLYRALGWEDVRPKFAHLPLILKPAGNGKLSKRDGDKFGFPVFPLQWKDPESGEVAAGYREDGYFPEAFLNMLLMLGWNPGTEQELFSKEEMTAQFSLERVVKSGARFSPEKAKWFNEHYLRSLSPDDLAHAVMHFAPSFTGVSSDRMPAMCAMLAERSSLLPDLLAHAYLYERPTEYDEKTARKKWKDNTTELITELRGYIAGLDDFSEAGFDAMLQNFVQAKEIGFGTIGPVLRLLLTGAGGGPAMGAIAAFLGKEEVLERIDAGLKKLG
ncbi:MAG: glutamate--tRNA ligase [Flavobacteriales bacterium]|nr:glutamate--tRNA ligase [Flavobacteriales bacterium]